MLYVRLIETLLELEKVFSVERSERGIQVDKVYLDEERKSSDLISKLSQRDPIRVKATLNRYRQPHRYLLYLYSLLGLFGHKYCVKFPISKPKMCVFVFAGANFFFET